MTLAGFPQTRRAAQAYECDLKRENVDARLRLLGDGSENVIPFDHPKFGELYRSEVKKLVFALKINPKAIGTRVAFRNLIDCIVVHPGRKRMPYEYTPYLNSAALFGMKLSPNAAARQRKSVCLPPMVKANL
ncbi:hypothetical protein [Bradyrhizobium sp. LHD-71]|uniref:hypothetical protein n=1 Tax=Bradyrhizobium sp. LHD-71 TaxID=3072141 RepID=UPI0028105F5A|nr:hypothetical protein [Bradyrhizobium sp. LHD-71]MDQ8726747.1 hypothetical protein [Bradyrhizobium sp. LHD-71]